MGNSQKNNSEDILLRIKNKNIIVGILGLGYVGFPLAVTFALKGTRVLGFEKSIEKINQVSEEFKFVIISYQSE